MASTQRTRLVKDNLGKSIEGGLNFPLPDMKYVFFRPRKGAKYGPDKIEKLGKEITQYILIPNQGKITTDMVIEWARENPDSELYTLFEWDDKRAALNYNRGRASRVLRAIDIEIIVPVSVAEPRREYRQIITRPLIVSNKTRSSAEHPLQTYFQAESLSIEEILEIEMPNLINALKGILVRYDKYRDHIGDELSRIQSVIDDLRRAYVPAEELN